MLAQKLFYQKIFVILLAMLAILLTTPLRAQSNATLCKENEGLVLNCKKDSVEHPSTYQE